MEHRVTSLKAQRIQQNKLNEENRLLSILPVKMEKLRQQLMGKDLLKDGDRFNKLEAKLTKYEDTIRSIRSKRKSKYAGAAVFSTLRTNILSN